MKILCIDDNLDILSLLQMTMDMMGHEYDQAEGGREGLEKILANHYDVVFLDLQMPEFDGKDVLNALNEKNRVKDQKIILFTASYIRLDEVGDSLSKMGIYKILQKPADIDELVEVLEEVEKKSGS